jgi:hypothetical protein
MAVMRAGQVITMATSESVTDDLVVDALFADGAITALDADDNVIWSAGAADAVISFPSGLYLPGGIKGGTGAGTLYVYVR